MRVQHSPGFTLIELMIAVAVVGILAAIAYPSYQDSVRKSRRADAKSALLDAAQRQERFYTENNQYTSRITPAADPCSNTLATIKAGTDCGLGYAADTTTDGYYKLTIAAPEVNTRRNTFTITATPVTGKSQTQDSNCEAFTLNQTGVKCVKGGTYCSNGDAAAKTAVANCW